MGDLGKSGERQLYPLVGAWLRALLEAQFASVHLEVSAAGTFTNVLKQMIDPSREIIFSFLRDAAPDLTGFVKRDRSSSVEFVVVEVKTTPIKLADIYQTRKYADLFDAHYALLLTPRDIPEEILRLSRVAFPYITLIPGNRHISLVKWRDGGNSVEWVPDDPFARM
jgi:hypothetical protein